MDKEDIEDLLREVKKLRRLHQAVKAIVDDDDYEAGHIACAGNCNAVMGWGPNATCDCYVKDVHQALDALNGTVLDDIIEALGD
jgi:hypothetical protein